MYLLRIFAGGTLWNIELSPWIILCTFFLSLFLISGKRRSEFHNLNEAKTSRKVLRHYNITFLDHLLTISTTATIVTYALYTVNTNQELFVYSSFLVTFGIIRYAYLIYQFNIGQSPEQTLTRDPWIIATVVIWAGYSTYLFT